MQPDLLGFVEYYERPIRLSSGGWSHFLINADRIFEHVALRSFLVRKLLDDFNITDKTAHVWTAPPESGTKWAKEIAEVLGTSYVTPFEAKKRSLVYAVDDVVTTGRSLLGMPAQRFFGIIDRAYNLRIPCVWRLPLP